MPDILKSIRYAEPSGANPHQRLAHSILSFDETLVRLKEAIQAEGLLLLHEIDTQMILGRGGYAIPSTRQILFFHPRYMVRLLEADPSAVMEAPLRLLVMEMPDGTVVLRHPDPDAALAPYAGLASLGSELSLILMRILATVSA